MGRRTTVATAALVALGLVDVALIGLLLRPGHRAAASSIALQPGAASASAGVFALPTPSTSGPSVSGPTGSPQPSPATVSPGPLVAPASQPGLPVDAGSGGFVLRADPGACSSTGKAELWFSASDGATWVHLSLPPGVREIRRVAIESPTALWFVGAGPDCVPRLWRSTDAGKGWTGPTNPTGAWFAPMSGSLGAHTPKATDSTLCSGSAVVGLAPSGAAVAALACADGSVLWTADAGQAWHAGATLPGVRAIALWTPQRGLALQATPDCPGLAVVVTADGGSSWKQTGCLTGAPGSGPVGVAVAGASVSVVVAGTGPKVGVWVSPSGALGWAQTAP